MSTINRHINYRDSKLTRILKPSLSGNARMAVICCITPSDSYVEETRSTLQFATRAKLVKTSAVANEVVDDADVVAGLRREIARGRRERQALETALEAQAAEVRDLRARLPGADAGAEPVAAEDKSHSTGAARYPNLDHRHSMIDELRSPDRERGDSDTEEYGTPDERRASLVNKTRSRHEEAPGKHRAFQDAGEDPQDPKRLVVQLLGANNLIADLRRQIDELRSQKNDALDWIEVSHIVEVFGQFFRIEALHGLHFSYMSNLMCVDVMGCSQRPSNVGMTTFLHFTINRSSWSNRTRTRPLLHPSVIKREP